MKLIRDFFHLMNWQVLIVTVLSLFATALCIRFEYIADLPNSLIGLAVVFPIVFAINAAYRRREESLRYFASLKANAIAIYYAHRDWVPADSEVHAARIRPLVLELFQTLRVYFSASTSPDAEFGKIYELFSKISRSNELLRDADVPANEISRINQYLHHIIVEFERMRNIYLYRTPRSLRTYSRIFLNSFPIAFAPYFAFLSVEYGLSVGYLIAVVYSVVLVSLANIQEYLENPYDEIGADDINLNIAGYYTNILDPEHRETVKAAEMKPTTSLGQLEATNNRL